MPLSRALAERSFDPEMLSVIAHAFDLACAELKLASKSSDPLTKLLAKKVIEVAEQGERDPRRLCERVLAALDAA